MRMLYTPAIEGIIEGIIERIPWCIIWSFSEHNPLTPSDWAAWEHMKEHSRHISIHDYSADRLYLISFISPNSWSMTNGHL